MTSLLNTSQPENHYQEKTTKYVLKQDTLGYKTASFGNKQRNIKPKVSPKSKTINK